MSILLLESWRLSDCTLGRLRVGGFQCFTLELPWLNNQPKVSCIPAGVYPIKYRISPKNGRVLQLEDVPGRAGIQIHAGNFTRQILGCILVGDGIKFLDNDNIPDVTNSKQTLDRLLDLVEAESRITISRV